MNFDKTKVYTALNAEELKVGSKVIYAYTISELKERVEEDKDITELRSIYTDSNEHRFCFVFGDVCRSYPLAYLISEPEEKKLKWTDLRIGDVITKDGTIAMVVQIDKSSENTSHICAGHFWVKDKELEKWEKVEE